MTDKAEELEKILLTKEEELAAAYEELDRLKNSIARYKASQNISSKMLKQLKEHSNGSNQ